MSFANRFETNSLHICPDHYLDWVIEFDLVSQPRTFLAFLASAISDSTSVMLFIETTASL